MVNKYGYGNKHSDADAEPGKKAQQAGDNDPAGSDRGRSVSSEHLSCEYLVYSTVKLLYKAASEKRQGKSDQLSCDRALCEQHPVVMFQFIPSDPNELIIANHIGSGGFF